MYPFKLFRFISFPRLDAVAATRARVAARPGRLDGGTHGGRALDAAATAAARRRERDLPPPLPRLGAPWMLVLSR